MILQCFSFSTLEKEVELAYERQNMQSNLFEKLMLLKEALSITALRAQ